MEREALTIEVLSIAQAVKNSGGIVLVQVERVTTAHMLNPREVRIPGILVDGVVLARPENHRQTFAEAYDPAYTGEVRTPLDTLPPLAPGPRKAIARRGTLALKPNSIAEPASLVGALPYASTHALTSSSSLDQMRRSWPDTGRPGIATAAGRPAQATERKCGTAADQRLCRRRL